MVDTEAQEQNKDYVEAITRLSVVAFYFDTFWNLNPDREVHYFFI